MNSLWFILCLYFVISFGHGTEGSGLRKRTVYRRISSPFGLISPKGTLNQIDIEKRTVYGQRYNQHGENAKNIEKILQKKEILNKYKERLTIQKK